jgi:hypothetical protein
MQERAWAPGERVRAPRAAAGGRLRPATVTRAAPLAGLVIVAFQGDGDSTVTLPASVLFRPPTQRRPRAGVAAVDDFDEVVVVSGVAPSFDLTDGVQAAPVDLVSDSDDGDANKASAHDQSRMPAQPAMHLNLPRTPQEQSYRRPPALRSSPETDDDDDLSRNHRPLARANIETSATPCLPPYLTNIPRCLYDPRPESLQSPHRQQYTVSELGTKSPKSPKRSRGLQYPQSLHNSQSPQHLQILCSPQVSHIQGPTTFGSHSAPSPQNPAAPLLHREQAILPPVHHAFSSHHGCVYGSSDKVSMPSARHHSEVRDLRQCNGQGRAQTLPKGLEHMHHIQQHDRNTARFAQKYAYKDGQGSAHHDQKQVNYGVDTGYRGDNNSNSQPVVYHEPTLSYHIQLQQQKTSQTYYAHPSTHVTMPRQQEIPDVQMRSTQIRHESSFQNHNAIQHRHQPQHRHHQHPFVQNDKQGLQTAERNQLHRSQPMQPRTFRCAFKHPHQRPYSSSPSSAATPSTASGPIVIDSPSGYPPVPLSPSCLGDVPIPRFPRNVTVARVQSHRAKRSRSPPPRDRGLRSPCEREQDDARAAMADAELRRERIRGHIGAVHENSKAAHNSKAWSKSKSRLQAKSQVMRPARKKDKLKTVSKGKKKISANTRRSAVAESSDAEWHYDSEFMSDDNSIDNELRDEVMQICDMKQEQEQVQRIFSPLYNDSFADDLSSAAEAFVKRRNGSLLATAPPHPPRLPVRVVAGTSPLSSYPSIAMIASPTPDGNARAAGVTHGIVDRGDNFNASDDAEGIGGVDVCGTDEEIEEEIITCGTIPFFPAGRNHSELWHASCGPVLPSRHCSSAKPPVRVPQPGFSKGTRQNTMTAGEAFVDPQGKFSHSERTRSQSSGKLATAERVSDDPLSTRPIVIDVATSSSDLAPARRLHSNLSNSASASVDALRVVPLSSNGQFRLEQRRENLVDGDSMSPTPSSPTRVPSTLNSASPSPSLVTGCVSQQQQARKRSIAPVAVDPIPVRILGSSSPLSQRCLPPNLPSGARDGYVTAVSAAMIANLQTTEEGQRAERRRKPKVPRRLSGVEPERNAFDQRALAIANSFHAISSVKGMQGDKALFRQFNCQCQLQVDISVGAVQCGFCTLWTHGICSGLSNAEYVALVAREIIFACSECDERASSAGDTGGCATGGRCVIGRRYASLELSELRVAYAVFHADNFKLQELTWFSPKSDVSSGNYRRSTYFVRTPALSEQMVNAREETVERMCAGEYPVLDTGSSRTWNDHRPVSALDRLAAKVGLLSLYSS